MRIMGIVLQFHGCVDGRKDKWTEQRNVPGSEILMLQGFLRNSIPSTVTINIAQYMLVNGAGLVLLIRRRVFASYSTELLVCIQSPTQKVYNNFFCSQTSSNQAITLA